MSSNHQLTVISHAQLPSAENVVFSNTSFFQHNGTNATLPKPAAVRKAATLPKTGVWAKKPCCVPFISQGLVVKYGPGIEIAEAQCMWAIRRSLGHHVPVPEVYGWCRDEGEVFIYMQYIQGATLNEAMDKLDQSELLQVMDQLRQIVIALRSLRQPPGESFLGKFVLNLSLSSYKHLNRKYFRWTTIRNNIRRLPKASRTLF